MFGVFFFYKIVVVFSVGFKLEENLRKFKYVILFLFLLFIVVLIGVVIGYIVIEVGDDVYG